MRGQMPLFGTDLKQQGMALAADAEDRSLTGFIQAAIDTIEQVAREQQYVTVNDVVPLMTIQPAHYNAWGTVWQKAQSQHIIQRVEGHTTTAWVNAEKHDREIPIYRSLIYRGPAR